jgi:hypothetical protein
VWFEDAHVHVAGVQINAAVVLLLLRAESHAGLLLVKVPDTLSLSLR